MNLNVKLDGEEEQALQYVNRFAINIPSGAAAINLNIVNPALGNQSYILNPMNSVGQNIVAYQPPMALQSYIALPTEGEGNIIHSLPVGVPVPVGLPVPTGLLQNNFVNTSIIIGDEECNSPGVIKSSSDLNSENEIKINYIETPVEKLSGSKPNGIEVQSVGVNCSPQINPEAVVKKPCPLEMSIKAANIDMEFDKCEPEVPILLDNCQASVEKTPLLVETVSLPAELKDSILKVPLEVSSAKAPNPEEANTESKKVKTEITWENNNKEELVDNGFQESLICEVEEEDEDEDEDEDDEDDEDEDVEDEEEEEEEVEEEEEADEEEDDDDYEEEDEEDSGTENEVYKTNSVGAKLGVNSNEGSSSSEESDSLPLSVALKLNKLPNCKSSLKEKSKRGRDEKSSNDISSEGGKSKKKKSQRFKKKKEGDEDVEEEDEEWLESDDDVLNLKRIKNEFNYKCFYEPSSAKSTTSLVLKIDDKSNKFVRVRSCCSKRECGKKISVQDQKNAYRHFHELESGLKRDGYLMNCIEHVQKIKSLENAKEKSKENLLEKSNIQLEIENESNGNQKLSDEIQKAINESLKDCVANEEERKGDEGNGEEKEEGGTEKKNSWNFYIVIDRCRKKVCLQFLLKLFQIPKSRIKNLQKKIISGSPLVEDSGKGSQKPSDVWEVAKSHLEGLGFLECADCNANPRHRFLSERRTKEDLFDSFKDFYYNKLGKAPNVKYASYKRFLDKKTSISFCLNKEGVCAECEELKKNNKRKEKKSGTSKGKKSNESKRQWVVKSESEERSSDDEPLLKRKKLKLTIPLKAVGSKVQGNAGKRNSKKYSVDNKSKGKSKQSGSRGRDVWSLMLLHLETMPYKECKSCVGKKRHRFLDSRFTTQGLFEDYRKYFLKETNSELGLGFTMYEKYFNRNCNYTICDVDVNAANCPRCAFDGFKS